MAQFKRDVLAGKNVHAYIIQGADGSGKALFAEQAAALLNCTGSPRPCGVCLNCKQTAHGTLPDLYRYIPRKRNIPVEDMRQLISSLSAKPHSAQFKICIIEQAELMNDSSQNCILKTLEEPPGNTVFFLLTDNAEVLLPTIRSRCRLINMPSVPDEALRDILKINYPDMPLQRIEEAVDTADGVPGLADKLLCDEVFHSRYEEAGVFLSLLLKGEYITDAFNYITERREIAGEILDLSILRLRRDLLKNIGQDQAPIGPAVKIIDALAQAQRDLKRYSNFNLTIDRLLININTSLK